MHVPQHQCRGLSGRVWHRPSTLHESFPGLPGAPDQGRQAVGDLPGEIDWDAVSRTAGRTIEERTTVTQNLRRVANFDAAVVLRAIAINNPTDIVLNQLDYIDGTAEITDAKIEYVRDIEARIGRRIDWLGMSPDKIIPRPECS